MTPTCPICGGAPSGYRQSKSTPGWKTVYNIPLAQNLKTRFFETPQAVANAVNDLLKTTEWEGNRYVSGVPEDAQRAELWIPIEYAGAASEHCAIGIIVIESVLCEKECARIKYDAAEKARRIISRVKKSLRGFARSILR